MLVVLSLEKGLQMREEDDVNVLYYGIPYTIDRLAKAYGCHKQLMNNTLCRAEYYRWQTRGSIRPRKYMWNPIVERQLDAWLGKKGFKRCIGSQVRSKYSLEKESLS